MKFDKKKLKEMVIFDENCNFCIQEEIRTQLKSILQTLMKLSTISHCDIYQKLISQFFKFQVHSHSNSFSIITFEALPQPQFLVDLLEILNSSSF